MIIAVEKSPLKRVVYGFWINCRYDGDIQIVFDHYTVEERQTKRHKWLASAGWSRLGLGRRESGIWVKRPALPADIAERVKAEVAKSLVLVEDYDAPGAR